MRHFPIRLTVLMLGVCFIKPLFGSDWSSFQNGGRTTAAALLPTEWSPDEKVAWSVPIPGYGQSSPVVAGDNIYCTSVSGENKEILHVTCFAADLGQQLWKYDLRNSSPEKNSSYVSRAAPTPVCDDTGVIAFFEGGNVVALDDSGKLRWQRDLVADYGPIKARHGLGASVEQSDSSVFVWVERQNEPYLLCLSKKSGETIWKVDGVGSTSWSSPRLVPVGASSHLVVSASGKLAGHDPVTGRRLWSFDDISGNTTPTPVPLGDGRFLVGASAGRGESGGGKAAESNGVIEVTKSDDGSFTADYVWRAERATCSFGSPCAHNGNAYFVNRSGVVYCLDLQTGEELYAKRTKQSTWATPIGCGDHIYLFGRSGVTTVIESGPRFKLVAENALWKTEQPAAEGDGSDGRMNFGGAVLYAAAIVDSGLLLRRGDRLDKVTR